MNRTSKLIAIYQELRQTINAGVGPGEILASAASLIDLFSDEVDGPQFDLRTGRLPFEMLGVDVALSDGGWRVLNLEWREFGVTEDDAWGGQDPLRRWDS